jgi:hypothetical protein
MQFIWSYQRMSLFHETREREGDRFFSSLIFDFSQNQYPYQCSFEAQEPVPQATSFQNRIFYPRDVFSEYLPASKEKSKYDHSVSLSFPFFFFSYTQIYTTCKESSRSDIRFDKGAFGDTW